MGLGKIGVAKAFQCPSGNLAVLGLIPFANTQNGMNRKAVGLLRKNVLAGGGALAAGWSRVYAPQNTTPAAVAGEAARAASEGDSAPSGVQYTSGMRQPVFDAKVAAGSVVYFLCGASGGNGAGWYLYNPTQLWTSGTASAGTLKVFPGSGSYPGYGSQPGTLATDPNDYTYAQSQLPALQASLGPVWPENDPSSLLGGGVPSNTLASVATTASTSSLFMLALLAAGGAFLYYEL